MKIKTKITLSFLLISLVLFTMISISSYLIADRALTQQIINQVQSVAAIQKSRVESIIEQNLERLILVSSRTQLRLSLENYIREPRVEYQNKMYRILTDARSSISSFKNISVLTLDGTIVTSTSIDKIGSKHTNEEFFIRGKKENNIDIFFLDKDRNLMVCFSGPLYLENRIIGVVMIESEADRLISLVKNYSGLGETGETLLAKRNSSGDALFITPLRFDPKASLSRSIDKDDLSAPITQALLKNKKFLTDALDYRGQYVLAATEYIDKTDWGLVVKIDKQEAFTPITKLRDTSLLIILLSSITVILISFFLSQSITKPIANLTDVANRITKGDFFQRAEITSKDEIGIFVQAFNIMSEKLIADINERKRAEEEVKKHSALLEEAIKELESFSYSVSHDLRAPLRGINGWSKALEEDYSKILNEQAKIYLQRIRSETNKMAELIDDLLELSRITRSKMKVDNVDLTSIAHAVILLMRDNYKERKIDFIVEPGLIAKGDRGLLETAITNLFDNACKFTGLKKQAKIEFGTTKVNDKSVFFIRDNGTGFDMKYAKNLFGAFNRMHKSSEFPGPGVGLATVQRIIHRHNGHIWAEAKSNKGATFYFSLPKITNDQLTK